MSVFRRKTTKGHTDEYHYRFMVGGKIYCGVCVGCSDKDSATTYENDMRAKVDELSKQRNVKALVENFRSELCGSDKLKLVDCWEEFMSKPTFRQPTENYLQKKKNRWQTFVDFMREKYPQTVYLHEITAKQAESYISYLRQQSKAPSTVNAYHKCASEIFGRLSSSDMENPFADIPLMRDDGETREAFSEKELELILNRAPDFIRAIFVVGFFTAFREGDICTLRWSDVLWEHGVIRRKLLKTGVVVEVPIMPPLANFLRDKQINSTSEYVLPAHAEMYNTNPSGVSYRVKKFLEDELKIQTTKHIPGRERAISIKDVHSLRHTFCYFAGVSGIPLVVVQSIVGHMTPEMTAHYTAHTDRKTKRDKLAALPFFNAMVIETERKPLLEQLRSKIIAEIEKANSDTLQRIADMLLPQKPKRLLLRNKC